MATREIQKPPQSFDGSLTELFDRWAQNVLIAEDTIAEFHQLLVRYARSDQPLFLVRMVTGMTRGITIRTPESDQIRPTDNAPAWWIHRELFAGRVPSWKGFDQFIQSIPCHMFAVGSGENVSKAGWHVAHVFDAKNGDVSYASWGRAELTRRMFRNLHPCNYFYIPKHGWQRHGGQAEVISFFAHVFSRKYSAVWPEFLEFVSGARPIADSSGNYRYSYSATATSKLDARSLVAKVDVSSHDYAASYSYSRLCFKADVIEPLAMTDKFCVYTKHGNYVFSKQEFYDVFPGVVVSASYKSKGIYHFPSPPARAEAFRVGSRPSSHQYKG